MKGGLTKKYIFNITGILVVCLWLFLLFQLFNKENSTESLILNVEDQAGIGESKRIWKDILLNDKKVGYSINSIKQFEEGYYIQDELFLKLNLMGFEKGLYTITQSSVDSSFRLKNFYFKINSGVISYSISGKVEGNSLHIKTGRGRRAKTKVINLTEIPMLSSGLDQLFTRIDLKPGDSRRLSFFDPSTMTQKDAVFKVVEKDKIKINRIEYDTFRIESEMYGNKLTFWVGMNGDILKEEGFMGLTLIKSSAANAPLNIDAGDADDFYEIAAVTVDKKIPQINRLGKLRLKVEGLEDAEFDKSGLNNDRQVFENSILTVTKETEPFKTVFTVPYSGDDEEIKKYLKPEYNIESEDEKIIEKAREIAGNTRSPAALSKIMMTWVFNTLEKRPVVNIPSAVEVLETKTGDCNEHATLLTALLRAAGIPARISVGLVYTREKFFYHAWVEAYTGEWITMDPTFNQMPADVTHISLIRGNIDKQVEIMGVIGKLRLEVLDFEYH